MIMASNASGTRDWPRGLDGSQGPAIRQVGFQLPAYPVSYAGRRVQAAAHAGAPEKEPKRMITFHVRTDGSDAGDGTQENPFATIARAKQAVRKLVAAGLDDDVTVTLAPGRYELAEPLVFTAADSGSDDHAVTYAAEEGARAVISGGSVIGGWQEADSGRWRTVVGTVKAGEWYFRQLFVDGRRATRARTPNEDEYEHLLAAEFDDDYREHLLWVEPRLLAEWDNLDDVEAVMYSHWDVTRKRLRSVDTASGEIRTQGPHFQGIQRPVAGAPFYFENALEFLDAPGEWYLNRRTGELWYWPREGEDLAAAEVVAPRLATLVAIEGTAERPVRNLHFRGLSFEHAGWEMPPEGHRPIQAGFVFPASAADPGNQWNKGLWYDDFACVPVSAAICWQYAHDCSLAGCTVAHTGASGVHLRAGCCGNALDGNTLHDVGCNGIWIGEYWRHLYDHDRDADIRPEMVPTGNRVTSNTVHHCACELEDGVGIGYGFTHGTVIARNHLHHLPYTGISAGFIWTFKATCCRENRIERNHIHHVMLRMADGGGIYTLGYQPGAVIRRNLIHDVPRHDEAIGAPNNGIFMDEGSKGFLVEGNVIYQTAGRCVRHNENLPAWQTWKDNIFCEEGEPDAAAIAACEAGVEA
jgi:hypothetical protein